MTDAYEIARMLLKKYGENASTEIRKNIDSFTKSNRFNALKNWYDIESALSEIIKEHENNSAKVETIEG